jgi:hypothetical protein
MVSKLIGDSTCRDPPFNLGNQVKMEIPHVRILHPVTNAVMLVGIHAK